MSAALKEVILLTAMYYGRTISEPVLNMYVDDLEDLSIPDVIEAYKTYRRNPKNSQFPMPAQIRGLVAPEVDPDSAAREIAARITGAVVKFGYANAPQAKTFVGEHGWAAIERSGGWHYVCTNLGVSIDPGVFQAQIREQVKSDLKFTPTQMGKAIGIALAPNIKRGELQSIGEIMGGLPPQPDPNRNLK